VDGSGLALEPASAPAPVRCPCPSPAHAYDGDALDPYVYQYAVGGAVFGVGLWYAHKQSYIGFSGQGLRNLLILLGGLAFFMVLQGWLQYSDMTERPAVPYDGPPPPKPGERSLGTGLDYAIVGIYFAAILAIGTWFGRRQKTSRDFFFGGQRFSWWLIAFSLVATTVGSASFVKYSKVAFGEGLASSQTYLNDWLWTPLLLFGWLPILYFSRVTSIPEYFERRFSPQARRVVTWLLLAYLIGYVGVNLFTMGKALNILLGWPIPLAAIVVAGVSAVYVTAGGQTSVIMTDLFQGVMLLAVGGLLVWFGAEQVGGLEPLWENMPRGHRTAFANFNEDPGYNSVGIFWQDAMANSAMFYFLNQGIIMRFLAARSLGEGRKAVVSMLLVLMPIAAIVVASGGWVARALVNTGDLSPETEGAEAFFVAAEFLSQPGVFGLVMAALTAALMSTVDTLITAVAAIVVNDVYKPKHPEATDADLLRVARGSSIGVALIGIALVPLFMMFESIYAAHGAFTAAVTPPMVVALLFGVFWKRYTTTAAIWTMAGGAFAIVVSIFIPDVVAPFAHGVPPKEVGDGLFEGAKQYKFMRAFYGLSVSAIIGVVVTLASKPRDAQSLRGLVWGTVADALARYKGSPGTEAEGNWVRATVAKATRELGRNDAGLPLVNLSKSLAEQLEVGQGNLVFVSDTRRWLGGLRASQAVVGEIVDAAGGTVVTLDAGMYEGIVTASRADKPLRIKRLC